LQGGAAERTFFDCASVSPDLVAHPDCFYVMVDYTKDLHRVLWDRPAAAFSANVFRHDLTLTANDGRRVCTPSAFSLVLNLILSDLLAGYPCRFRERFYRKFSFTRGVCL